MTGLNIVALVPIGAHPASGRSCRIEQDAHAVELDLCLSDPRLQVLRAGDLHAEALRGYLGMGLERLSVLEQPAGADALPALAEYLRDSRAQLVFTGSQAETEEGSGMLPFLLAERLGWPLVVGLAKVEKIEDGSTQVFQALPRGQRCRLRVCLPFIASVDNAVPVVRQSAFGPARRDETEAHEVEVVDDPLLAEDSLQPVRPRPKRLEIIKARTGVEWVRAATAKAPGGTGQALRDLSAEAGAEAIFKLLHEEGVIR